MPYVCRAWPECGVGPHLTSFRPSTSCALINKEPDAVQAVRDWLEKTLEEFSEQWPKAKKQARAIQDDLVAEAQGVSKKLHFRSR